MSHSYRHRFTLTYELGGPRIVLKDACWFSYVGEEAKHGGFVVGTEKGEKRRLEAVPRPAFERGAFLRGRP